MRLGLYGGTFDPLHLGHLVLAERALESLRLDHLVLVPVGVPALKGAARASAADRLAMVTAAVGERERFEVSDLELRRGGTSYTVETLESLSAERSGDWWVILGADALVDFPRWREPERILELARLGVAGRPGTDWDGLLESLPERVASQIDPIEMPQLAISSTELREDRAAGRSIRYLVPDQVYTYLTEHRLYAND